MNELIILQGLPASGKSTWALEWVKKDPVNRIRVNRDTLRKMLSSDWYKDRKTLSDREEFLTKLEETIVTRSLLEGKSVVVDACNFRNPERWKTVIDGIELIQGYKVKFYLHSFHPGLEECIKRDNLRTSSDKVGSDVIFNMYKRYIDKEAEKDPNWKLKFDIRNYNLVYNDLPKAFIFDIDGTLSLMNGRNPYKGEDCKSDLGNVPVINLLRHFQKTNKIILFSGRNSDKGSLKATQDWLFQHEVPYHKLIMRTPGDSRKDTVIKKEMFDSIKNDFNILGIFDDRDCVVKMWRDLGIPCYQVWYGDF